MSNKLRLGDISPLAANLRAKVESGKELGVFDIMQYAVDATSAIEDLLVMAGSTPADVWIATIEHKHGIDKYVGSDEESCLALVLEYVQENWDSFCTDGHPIPDDPKQAIELYFEAAGEHEYMECNEWDIITKKLPEYAPEPTLPAIRPCPGCRNVTPHLDGLKVSCWCGASGPNGSTEYEAITFWNRLPR